MVHFIWSKPFVLGPGKVYQAAPVSDVTSTQHPPVYRLAEDWRRRRLQEIVSSDDSSASVHQKVWQTPMSTYSHTLHTSKVLSMRNLWPGRPRRRGKDFTPQAKVKQGDTLRFRASFAVLDEASLRPLSDVESEVTEDAVSEDGDDVAEAEDMIEGTEPVGGNTTSAPKLFTFHPRPLCRNVVNMESNLVGADIVPLLGIAGGIGCNQYRPSDLRRISVQKKYGLDEVPTADLPPTPKLIAASVLLRGTIGPEVATNLRWKFELLRRLAENGGEEEMVDGQRSDEVSIDPPDHLSEEAKTRWRSVMHYVNGPSISSKPGERILTANGKKSKGHPMDALKPPLKAEDESPVSLAFVSETPSLVFLRPNAFHDLTVWGQDEFPVNLTHVSSDSQRNFFAVSLSTEFDIYQGLGQMLPFFLKYWQRVHQFDIVKLLRLVEKSCSSNVENILPSTSLQNGMSTAEEIHYEINEMLSTFKQKLTFPSMQQLVDEGLYASDEHRDLHRYLLNDVELVVKYVYEAECVQTMGKQVESFTAAIVTENTAKVSNAFAVDFSAAKPGRKAPEPERRHYHSVEIIPPPAIDGCEEPDKVRTTYAAIVLEKYLSPTVVNRMLASPGNNSIAVDYQPLRTTGIWARLPEVGADVRHNYVWVPDGCGSVALHQLPDETRALLNQNCPPGLRRAIVAFSVGSVGGPAFCSRKSPFISGSQFDVSTSLDDFAARVLDGLVSKLSLLMELGFFGSLCASLRLGIVDVSTPRRVFHEINSDTARRLWLTVASKESFLGPGATVGTPGEIHSVLPADELLFELRFDMAYTASKFVAYPDEILLRCKKWKPTTANAPHPLVSSSDYQWLLVSRYPLSAVDCEVLRPTRQLDASLQAHVEQCIPIDLEGLESELRLPEPLRRKSLGILMRSILTTFFAIKGESESEISNDLARAQVIDDVFQLDASGAESEESVFSTIHSALRNYVTAEALAFQQTVKRTTEGKLDTSRLISARFVANKHCRSPFPGQLSHFARSSCIEWSPQGPQGDATLGPFLVPAVHHRFSVNGCRSLRAKNSMAHYVRSMLHSVEAVDSYPGPLPKLEMARCGSKTHMKGSSGEEADEGDVPPLEAVVAPLLCGLVEPGQKTVKAGHTPAFCVPIPSASVDVVADEQPSRMQQGYVLRQWLHGTLTTNHEAGALHLESVVATLLGSVSWARRNIRESTKESLQCRVRLGHVHMKDPHLAGRLCGLHKQLFDAEKESLKLSSKKSELGETMMASPTKGSNPLRIPIPSDGVTFNSMLREEDPTSSALEKLFASGSVQRVISKEFVKSHAEIKSHSMPLTRYTTIMKNSEILDVEVILAPATESEEQQVLKVGKVAFASSPLYFHVPRVGDHHHGGDTLPLDLCINVLKPVDSVAEVKSADSGRKSKSVDVTLSDVRDACETTSQNRPAVTSTATQPVVVMDVSRSLFPFFSMVRRRVRSKVDDLVEAVEYDIECDYQLLHEAEDAIVSLLRQLHATAVSSSLPATTAMTAYPTPVSYPQFASSVTQHLTPNAASREFARRVRKSTLIEQQGLFDVTNFTPKLVTAVEQKLAHGLPDTEPPSHNNVTPPNASKWTFSSIRKKAECFPTGVAFGTLGVIDREDRDNMALPTIERSVLPVEGTDDGCLVACVSPFSIPNLPPGFQIDAGETIVLAPFSDLAASRFLEPLGSKRAGRLFICSNRRTLLHHATSDDTAACHLASWFPCNILLNDHKGNALGWCESRGTRWRWWGNRCRSGSATGQLPLSPQPIFHHNLFVGFTPFRVEAAKPATWRPSSALQLLRSQFRLL